MIKIETKASHTTTLCNVCNQEVLEESFVAHLRKCEKENHCENVGIRTWKEHNYWIHEISTDEKLLEPEPESEEEMVQEEEPLHEEEYEEQIEEEEDIETADEQETHDHQEQDENGQFYEILYLEEGEADPQNHEAVESYQVVSDDQEYYEVIEEQVIDDVMDGMSYDRAMQVIKHQMKQEGKLSYLCERCQKPLQSKYSLERHVKGCEKRILSHTCKQCGKLYKLQKHLSRHLNEAHGVPLKCPRCGKSFSRKSNMDRHLETVHKTN